MVSQYDATASTYTTLIKCSSQSIGECQVVNITPGYYIGAQTTSEQSILIHCTETSCTREEMYGNYMSTILYYLDGDYNKNIISCSPNGCSSNPGEEGYYLNSGADIQDTHKMIKCDGSVCTTIAIGDGFYLTHKSSTNESSSVYKCKPSEGCSQQRNPNSNLFYFNGDTSDSNKIVFQCTNGTCEFLKVNEGYYINADDGRRINTPSLTYQVYSLIYCNANAECQPITDLNYNGYYSNGGRYDSTKYIIYCNGGLCDTLDLEPAIYINSGKDQSTYPILSCDYTSCKKVSTVNSSCTTIGTMIKVGETFKFCISHEDSQAVDIPGSGMDTDHTIYSLTIEEKGAFPGTDVGSVKVSVYQNGRVVLIPSDKESKGLPTCDYTSGKQCMNSKNSYGDACIKDRAIYKFDNKCQAVTSMDAQNSMLYFDRSNKLTNNGWNVVMAYKCQFNNNNSSYNDYNSVANNCRLVNGYFFSYSSIIHCNGLDETCTESSSFEECQEGDEGKLSKDYSSSSSSLYISLLLLLE